MAAGVGFVVGLATRWAAGGVSAGPPLAAVNAMLGCAVGNALSLVYFVAEQSKAEGHNATYIDTLSQFQLDSMAQTFEPIDAIFYGLAVFGA